MVVGGWHEVASDGPNVVDGRKKVRNVASIVLGDCATLGEDHAEVAQK